MLVKLRNCHCQFKVPHNFDFWFIRGWLFYFFVNLKQSTALCLCCYVTKIQQSVCAALLVDHLKMNMTRFLLLQCQRSTLNTQQIPCHLALDLLLWTSSSSPPSSMVKEPPMWDCIISRNSFTIFGFMCVLQPSLLPQLWLPQTHWPPPSVYVLPLLPSSSPSLF